MYSFAREEQQERQHERALATMPIEPLDCRGGFHAGPWEPKPLSNATMDWFLNSNGMDLVAELSEATTDAKLLDVAKRYRRKLKDIAASRNEAFG